jgi:hypothetical protein
MKAKQAHHLLLAITTATSDVPAQQPPCHKLVIIKLLIHTLKQ